MALAVISVNKKDKDKFNEVPATFPPIKVVTGEIIDQFVQNKKDLLIGGYPNTYIEDHQEVYSKYFLYTHEDKIEGQRTGRKRIVDEEEEDESDEENFKYEDLPGNLIGLSSVVASQGQDGSPILIDGQVIGVHVGIGRFTIEDLNNACIDDY